MTASSTQPAPLTRESLQGLLGASQGGFERLPLLRQALERVGPACTEDIKAIAAVPLRLTLEGITSGTSGDVLPKEAGDAAVALLAAPGWGTQLFACADRAAAFAIVEALLGGDGSQPRHAEERPLSGIETGVAGVFFAAVTRALAQAFAPIAASTFAVEATSDEIDFDAISRDQAVVVARYRLDALEPCGELAIAIPQTALSALRKALSEAPKAEAEAQADPDWAQHIAKQVTRSSVTLTAILDERPGLLAEVFNLEVGQIIGLQATSQSRVRVECNGERLVLCELGKSNGVYTLRVDAFIDHEQQFMDDILAA
jgi:flagellar motor switch protein FliM